MKMIQIIWNSYWGKPSKLQKKFGKDYGNCFEFNDIIELNELAKYCERHYLSRPSLLGYKNEIKIIRIIKNYVIIFVCMNLHSMDKEKTNR